MSPIPTPTPGPNQHLNHTTITLSSGTIAHKWTPDQPPTATIILQHGYAEYAIRYLYSHHNLLHHLLHAHYAVYAMDIWGHGSSPGTRAVAHIGKAVTDHIELRHLAASPGLPVILFGHSLGGLITAGSVTKDSTSRIDGVILTGPALPGPFPCVARLVFGAVARCIPSVSVPGRGGDIAGLTRSEVEIDKYYADPLFYKKGVCFLLAATALDEADSVRAGVKTWTVPTLVLHGDSDTYCAWEASEKFVRGIVSQDKEFGVYEDGRHELLHDLEGDAVLERVMKWIEGHV